MARLSLLALTLGFTLAPAVQAAAQLETPRGISIEEVTAK